MIDNNASPGSAIWARISDLHDHQNIHHDQRSRADMVLEMRGKVWCPIECEFSICGFLGRHNRSRASYSKVPPSWGYHSMEKIVTSRSSLTPAYSLALFFTSFWYGSLGSLWSHDKPIAIAWTAKVQGRHRCVLSTGLERMWQWIRTGTIQPTIRLSIDLVDQIYLLC